MDFIFEPSSSSYHRPATLKAGGSGASLVWSGPLGVRLFCPSTVWPFSDDLVTARVHLLSGQFRPAYLVIYHSWPATKNNGWIFGVDFCAAVNIYPHPQATAATYTGASVRPHHLEDCPRRLGAPRLFSAFSGLASPTARNKPIHQTSAGPCKRHKAGARGHAFHHSTE